jgi:hypothetical protein
VETAAAQNIPYCNPQTSTGTNCSQVGETLVTTTPGGGTCDANFSATDGAGQGLQQYCGSSMSGTASVVGCHGAPGVMVGCEDDPALLQMMGQRANGDINSPIILTACNGGTGSANGSDAAAVAATAGTNPSYVYACCGGLVTSGAGGAQCGGGWCDGEGNMLSSVSRAPFGLQNCTMTAVNCGNGQPGCVVNSNCN